MILLNLVSHLLYATTFDKMPIFSIPISTSSLAFNVKSFAGTMPVPVIKKQPCSKTNSRNKYSASSVNFLFILVNLMELVNASSPLRLIFILIVVSNEISCSGTYKQGPSAALLSYIFACGKYKGFSPSISLELISLPTV